MAIPGKIPNQEKFQTSCKNSKFQKIKLSLKQFKKLSFDVLLC